MLKKIGAVVGTTAAIAIGSTVVLSDQAEKSRRFEPAPFKDNGLEFAVLVEEGDSEAISALNSALINAFCGGVTEGCSDTAEKSLSQTFDINGTQHLAAQWTLTSEQLQHMVGLKEQGSLRIYRSRRKFRSDTGQ